MSGAAFKPSRENMPQESIAAALLETEGYAAFEYLGDSLFQAIGAPSPFWAELAGEPADAGAPLRLTDRLPFLESFLPDAEASWNSNSEARVESGAWIERGAEGREIALEASAFRLGEKRVLLIRNPQKRFTEDVQVLQKARESALEHERLLREIQKKEILLHCVIHDLSQPLSAMRGCFSLLAAENLSPKLQGLVEIGQRQSENEEEMIRGVLQAFSAELAAQEAVPHDAASAPDLANCAREIANDFSAAFAAKGARIEVSPEIDFTRTWRVVGDISRLRRIYTNLIENALRYSPSGSTVTLGVAADGNFSRAYVDDEGPGLPSGESADRLFGLFAKGKKGGGKVGLGLYFCKITVERWGGAIGCENRPGGGTRFWFRLPVVELPADESEVAASASSEDSSARETKPKTSDKPLRLLLADDSPVNLQITTLLFEKRGHQVTPAGNGKEVLAQMEKQHFDAVILDEEMPQMSGLEATRSIRKGEESTGAHVPVILVTGNGSEASRARSREAGVDAHIAKPFQDRDLFGTVEDLCAGAGAEPRAVVEQASVALAFDAQALLERVGGNPKVLRELARISLIDTRKRMAAIRKAIAKNDGATLAGAAHALRSSMAMLGAIDISEDARQIEMLGRSGSIAEAGRHLAPIKVKLSAFEKVLGGIAAGPAKAKKPSRKTGGRRARRKSR
jgi:signal transduction histidine kinase/CheY-like chemotaxis protein